MRLLELIDAIQAVSKLWWDCKDFDYQHRCQIQLIRVGHFNDISMRASSALHLSSSWDDHWKRNLRFHEMTEQKVTTYVKSLSVFTPSGKCSCLLYTIQREVQCTFSCSHVACSVSRPWIEVELLQSEGKSSWHLKYKIQLRWKAV